MRNMLQPGSTAAARMSGKAAAMNEPRNGTKRMSVASTPHSTGLGTPMSHRPKAMKMPKAVLISVRVRK